MKIVIVAGARPNFIKIAPILKAVESSIAGGTSIEYRLIHTGQHYDDAMSTSFFRDLQIPEPHKNLNAGSGTQAEQTASIMVAFEKELMENRPNVVVVVGDVNSTMACTIVAKKLGIDVAHVEAGIRSGDMDMPEEINRIVTDSITDFFFTTTPEAGQNLLKTGVSPQRIFWVGNTMIDTLVRNQSRFRRPKLLDEHHLADNQYLVATLHRPSNVDKPETLQSLLETIAQNSAGGPILFPVHPRTQKTLSVITIPPSFILCPPQGYLEFLYLLQHCKGVITDSGGIQEETTYLKKPCITLRTTTERPETVTVGTNMLIGDDHSNIPLALKKLMNGEWKSGAVPELWDGKTSERIVSKIVELYS